MPLLNAFFVKYDVTIGWIDRPHITSMHVNWHLQLCLICNLPNEKRRKMHMPRIAIPPLPIILHLFKQLEYAKQVDGVQK